MQIFQQEYDDGISDVIKASASILYASAISPCDKELSAKTFKALASVDDSDLYYTQSILVSSSWNKNDDIFDKNEIWAARHSPEHKPTNLEHDEGTIIGHIVSNYPITEDGILIDENTPVENLPDKYHILTGAVIYKSYTKAELQERTNTLIAEIENGSKYVSMECFFKGFDYGLINKNSGEYKILARNNDTAYLSKYLRAYGGLGEHDNYKIGRVLRNITFSGKGYVDRPANPDSIIFSKDSFKFMNNNINLPKNEDISKSGVLLSQSNINSENYTMSNEKTEVVENEVVANDCTEATQAAETTIAELKSQIETLTASHTEALASLQTEKDNLTVQHEEAAKKMKDMEEEKKKMMASITDLEQQLSDVNNSLAAYMKKEKKMMRKAALLESGFEDSELDSIVDKFENVDDETFAAMTDVLKMKKKNNENKGKAEETTEEVTETVDLTEALENVEETAEVALTVGSEDNAVENTRAALVDFVYARLGKKLNKGE